MLDQSLLRSGRDLKRTLRKARANSNCSVLPFVRVPVRRLSQGVHKDTQTQEWRGGQVHRLFDARAKPVTCGLVPYQHRILQALSIGSFDAVVPQTETDR